MIGAANILCSEMGLDPVAAGGTVATAMELVDRKKTTVEELKVDLRFGNGEGMLETLRSMSLKKGPAEWLGKGAKALAEDFDSPETFMGVRGMPLSPFEPRAIQGMGLHFATSTCGPHHLYAYTFIEEVLNVNESLDPAEIAGKPALVKHYQDMTAVMDSLGLCCWPLMGLKLKNFVPLVNSCLGTNYTVDDLLAKGERITNVERIFGIRAGIDGSFDKLPARFSEEQLTGDAAEGQISRVREMLPEYYALRGWDEKGSPRPETLRALGLEEKDAAH